MKMGAVAVVIVHSCDEYRLCGGHNMAESEGSSRRPFLMLKELVDRELHYLKCLQALLYVLPTFLENKKYQ